MTDAAGHPHPGTPPGDARSTSFDAELPVIGNPRPPSPVPAAAGKRVYLESLGCVENALASARLMEFFSANRWQATSSVDDADLVLVNTCGVDEWQEEDSLRRIADLRQSLPDGARLVVTGCLVSINPDAVAEPATADAAVIRIDDAEALARLGGTAVALDEVHANHVPGEFMRARLRHFNRAAAAARLLGRIGLSLPSRLERALSAFELDDWFFVQIATGCVHACSYCAVRFAKGRIRSRPLDEVAQEVSRGIAGGSNRIVLVGDDTASYGLDLGSDLVELLARLGDLEGDFGIHVRNLEPMGLVRMLPRMLEQVRRGHIRALTVPLQSGSDRLLATMGRDYEVEPVLDALRQLRAARPELLLLTHVMVGFPGESRDDYRRTLDLLRRFPFDGVAPGCFSARRRTPAAGMDGQVGPLTKRLRYWRLLAAIIRRVYLQGSST